ncbi:hypothetical protein CJ030_MR1G003743 [Morella rubra]|uniref:Pentatricopeptide repeat-containing protein n=1 Tax=Morella rubra TaxID=262757 RepID=A0A6A1WU62_9ROSI|nr:hypothetical protein CJ030_MR1G003743 [Morella rubra]
MKDEYRIEPKNEHYGCMINLLGHAGHLEEAYELVKNMKIKPDLVSWGTFLGAYRLHDNIALGEDTNIVFGLQESCRFGYICPLLLSKSLNIVKEMANKSNSQITEILCQE